MADGVKDSAILVERLRTLIDAGDTEAVVGLFQGMSERDRRTLVRPVRDCAKEPALWGPGTGLDYAAASRQYNRRQKPIFVAGLAVISGAPAVAKWIAAESFQLGWDGLPIEACVEVLRERNPEWLHALPEEVCAAMDGMDHSVWALVNAIAELLGVQLSASANYVHGWVSKFWSTPIPDPDAALAFVVEEMRGERRHAEFLPVLFEGGNLDRFFGEWSHVQRAVVLIAADGGEVRDAVLDASLRRLLRSGRHGAVRDHTTLWAALEPTSDEIVAHLSGCISLLSSQYGFVVKEFLAGLKRAWDAGLLDVESAIEAASIAVTRQEKYLVKASLIWLEALARKYPDRTGELMTAAASGFASQGTDIQERAVKAVTKRAAALTPVDRSRIIDEARLMLPPHLATEVVAALGGGGKAGKGGEAGGDVDQNQPAEKTAYPELAPYTPRPMPKPIASPAELAEEFARLMTGEPDEAMQLERVLAAFVEFTATAPEELKASIAPVASRHERRRSWQSRDDVLTPRDALLRLAEAVSGSTGRKRSGRASFGEIWEEERVTPRQWASPAQVIAVRIVEIAAAIESGHPTPMLLSTPTEVTGVVDPKVLHERLRTAESEGWQPLETDFQQALLRMPADAGGVDGAGLKTEFGLVFADWCDGDRIDLPETSRVPHKFEWLGVKDNPWNRYQVLTEGRPIDRPLSLLALIPHVWRRERQTYDGSDWWNCWPALVPSRPDLAVAALYGAEEEDSWGADHGAVTALLAEADDPTHDALHFRVARQLADPQAEIRAAAVDAALILAARGLLDGVRLGADIAGTFLETGRARLPKIVPGLRDLANAGAAAQAWNVVAELLARLLPPAVPKTLTGTGELLAFATELADALDVRGPIASVAALAAKKGSGVVHTAARRLDAVLTGA